ncbi:hypothetical protein [Kitasatospora kazusensis]
MSSDHPSHPIPSKASVPGGSGSATFDPSPDPSLGPSPDDSPDDSPGIDSPSPLPSPSTESPTSDPPPATDSAAPSTTASAASQDPASVVLAYVAAIDARDYGRAWQLGGSNVSSDYQSFVSGFAATESVTATHTDGSVTVFTGTFTVVGGVITAAAMHAAN